MNKKTKKYIYNIIFLIVLFGLTAYVIISNSEVDDIISSVKEANKFFLLIGLLMVIVYVVGESYVIYYIMRSLNNRVKITSCYKYSFIGFFVSAITPSATGGQPAQLYYMSGDGISGAISTLVLMVVTIAYKTVLILLALVMLIIEFDFVMAHVGIIGWLMLFGLLVNIFMIIVMMLLIFKPSLARKLICKIIIWLGQKGIIKNYYYKLKNVMNAIEKYNNGSEYLKTHRKVFINSVLITFIQRIALFAITYFVYRSFYLDGSTFLEIVALQTMLALAVDNIPVPGGMGASEGVFVVFFKEIFTNMYLTSGLLITRLLNYYSILILGGVVMMYAQFTRKKHSKGKLE